MDGESQNESQETAQHTKYCLRACGLCNLLASSLWGHMINKQGNYKRPQSLQQFQILYHHYGESLPLLRRGSMFSGLVIAAFIPNWKSVIGLRKRLRLIISVLLWLATKTYGIVRHVKSFLRQWVLAKQSATTFIWCRNFTTGYKTPWQVHL